MLDVLNFTLDIKAVDFITGEKKDFTIDLTPDRRCTDAALIRARENASLFKLKELDKGHKDYA